MMYNPEVIDKVVNKLIEDYVADRYYCRTPQEANHYKARYRAEIKRMIEGIGANSEQYLKRFDEQWDKTKT